MKDWITLFYRKFWDTGFKAKVRASWQRREAGEKELDSSGKPKVEKCIVND